MHKKQRNAIQTAILTGQAGAKIDALLRGLTAIEIEVLKSRLINPDDLRPVINLGRGIAPDDSKQVNEN